MCGIAAVVRASIPFTAQKWPLWSGTGHRADGVLVTTTANNCAVGDTELPSFKEALKRRGPDFQNTTIVNARGGTIIEFLAAVLWLRGGQLTKQPACDGNNILLFNGEVYDGLEPSNIDEVDLENDTAQLLRRLSDVADDGDNLLNFLDQVRGPWSIIYWHQDSQRLYFGRDVLGRRSLQILVQPNGKTIIASTLSSRHSEDIREISPAGLFYLDTAGSDPTWGLIKRCTAILPSLSIKHSSAPNPNVGTETVLNAGVESMSFLPRRWHRELHRDGDEDEKEKYNGMLVLAPVVMRMERSVELFLCAFSKSIERRLKMTKRAENLGVRPEPRFAILFSGGIDSLFMAVMLDKCLARGERIDLINVAFGTEEELQKCADRRNAESAFIELHKLVSNSTQREFRMICVDVLPHEADRALHENVRPLVHPCDHLMDDSIGTALWFAGRSSGHYVRVMDDGRLEKGVAKVTSGAKVLFSGLGADELMGGYKGRHRTTFRRDGKQGIMREMNADLSRLWYRNLGRDDRVISDSGREVRHPFLDEDLIDLVTKLPLLHVCDLSLPDGVGDKQLLRRAAERVGLSLDATTRSKRAIQFGSRSKHVLERKRPAQNVAQ